MRLRLVVLCWLLKVNALFTEPLSFVGRDFFDWAYAHCNHKTEHAIYDALRNHPLLSKVTCLEIPWEGVINARRERHGGDLLIKALRGRDISKVRFSVCGNLGYKSILGILQKCGVSHFFVTQCYKRKFGKMECIPILFVPLIECRPAEHKDILYSFVGIAWSHRIRRKLFRLPRKGDVRLIRRPYWASDHQGFETKKRERAEYAKIAGRSRFGLCPRGLGLNTIRLSELLQAGTIPVIIADGIRLPVGVDWKKCAVFVRECDVMKVDKIIRAIPLDVEDLMRQECLRIGAMLDDDPAYFVRYYFENVWSGRRELCDDTVAAA